MALKFYSSVRLNWDMKALLTVHNFMYRKLIILFLALTLSWTNIAYARAEETTPSARNVVNTLAAAPTQLSDNGQYPVQQVTYDDTTGEYSLVLLNTSPGTPPVFRSQNLQMARLTGKTEEYEGVERKPLDSSMG